MITRIDRLQLAVRSRERSAALFSRLFDAALVREDRLPKLGALRSVLRLGESELELLEPDGLGIVAQHISRYPTPIFAVGLATQDLGAAQASLDGRAIHHEVIGDQLWLTGEWLGIPGMRVVLSRDAPHESVGLLSRLYEATHLMDDFSRAADRLAKVFDLDTANYVPIESDQYGYRGTLTRFQAGRLDRIETVTPRDRNKAMGRFYARRGPCLYMCFAECNAMRALRVRLDAEIPELWVGDRTSHAPDTLFVPPQALDGLLLGVSRESVAWGWSGAPDRVR